METEVLERRLDTLHREICERQRELLAVSVELDRRKRFERDGCRDMGQWLSGRIGVSTWRARHWMNAAHALEELPVTSKALAGGVLCLDKVVELTRYAMPETETGLVRWARGVSVRCIRQNADRATRIDRETVTQAEATRSFRWWYYDDGATMGLEGQLPIAQGAAIAKAVSRLADRLPDADPDALAGIERDSEDVFEARCADALWMLCSQGIATDQDPNRATVIVRMSIDALGNREWAEIDGASVIHPSVCDRLACDARLQFVLTDAKGDALGIGHTSRNPSMWLEREIRYRDHGCCTFPGCNQRAFLQSHHIRHWPDGGPTELGNLTTVCLFHHKLIHEHNWNVRLVGSVTHWLMPSGTRYDPGPDPPGEGEARTPALAGRSLGRAASLRRPPGS